MEVYLNNQVYNVEKIKTVDTKGVETRWITENSVNNIINLSNTLNAEVQFHTLIISAERQS